MEESNYKLILLIAFCMFMPIGMFAQISKKLDLASEEKTLKEFFQTIESKTEYTFMHNNIDLDQKVNINVNQTSLDNILKTVLTPMSLTYEVRNRQILIKNLIENIQSKPAESQPRKSVTGTVLDQNGETVIGANVIEKGTTNGTVTDMDGNFSLQIQEGAVLQISYIGYLEQDIIVGSQNNYSIILKEDLQALDEVVVVGYGTMKRSDLTGSVASVSTDRINNLTSSSFQQALQGSVPGVEVVQTTGSPGASMTVRIRGNGSITAGNDPLYVIDGFPVSGGSRGKNGFAGGSNPLGTLNPSDIESIDILKDASAAAIYGSRGANGVVIITTKRGKEGKGRITLDVYTGLQTASKKVDVLNAEEFAELHIESRHNGWVRSGGDPNTPNENRGRYAVTPIYLDRSQWHKTDWQDEVLRTGLIQSYTLGANGGNKNVHYALSANYYQNDGIVIETSMKRYAFRANIDGQVNNRLKVTASMAPSYTINLGAQTDGHFSSGGALGQAMRMPPIISPYNEDGSYTNPLSMRNASALGSIGAIDNPVAVLKEDEYKLGQARMLGSISAEYKIIEGLKFSTSFGFDGIFNRVHQFLSSKTGRGATPPPNVPSGMASSSQEIEWLNENLLIFQKEINEHNSLTATSGISWQKNDYQYIRINGLNYPNDNVQYVSAAGTVESGTENRNEHALLSYFGRVNYSLYNRYLLTTTLRRDGSSRFGKKKKYGLFPSAAIGWRMSEEEFMKNVSFITNLKWRLSYGVSGNNDIANYAHIPTLANNSYILGMNPRQVNAINANRLANEYVSWETMRSFNLGVDISMFSNRIDLSIDTYKSNTDGLLLDVNIPAVSGFVTSLENIGEVENRGLEIAINSRNITGRFNWDTGFNISFNRNKVLSLGGSAGDFIDSGDFNRTVVGKPMGLFYTRVTDGIFQTMEEITSYYAQTGVQNPQPGDRRFKDINGDQVIDNNDMDFTGDPNPDFIFGFTNNFRWKNFQLNIVINGSYGNDVYYRDPAALNLNGNVNNNFWARDRWRSPEQPGSGNIPRAVFGFTTYSDISSDFYVVDASFMRLSNATLSYTIPEKITRKINIENTRIYISGQNLVTWTKNYPGFDPEIGSGGTNPLQRGVDVGIYPLARVFTLGCNLTF